MAPEYNKHDMRLEFDGSDGNIKMLSYEAQKEVDHLIPSKIDRTPETRGFGKIFLKCFASIRSNSDTITRRKAFTKLLGLNSCSKYIPSMLMCIKNHTSGWNETDKHNITFEMNMITFTIFTVIMFGDDMEHVATQLIDYESSEGNTAKIELRQYFIRMIHDYTQGWMKPISHLLPFLNEMNLVNPFKRNKQNLDNFRAHLRKAISETKDEKSICKLLMEKEGLEPEKVFDDIVGFLVAGTETASHTLTVILYYLKKNPEKLVKVISELRSLGFMDTNKTDAAYSVDNLNDLDYLTYVIKEALRYDPPANQSLYYKAYEDVTICGVKIPKGTDVRKDILTVHLNGEQYKDPLKFIPERFDPESEFFSLPGENDKARRPYSHIPFSFGERNCPGQAFAMLEMRVILAYLLSHIEYSITEEQLQIPGIGFGIGSDFEIIMEITRLMNK